MIKELKSRKKDQNRYRKRILEIKLSEYGADRLENGHERSNCEFSISWEHSWLFTRNLFDSQELMNIYLTRCRAVRSNRCCFFPDFRSPKLPFSFLHPFSFFLCNSSTFFFFLSRSIGKNLELLDLTRLSLVTYRRRKWIKRENCSIPSISWTIKFLLTEM